MTGVQTCALPIFSEINFFKVRFSLRPGVYDEKPLGALAREKKLPKQGTVFLRNEREVVEKICMEILCVKFKITAC